MTTEQINWRDYTKVLNWFNLRLDQFLTTNKYYPNSIMMTEDVWNVVKSNHFISQQPNTFFGLNVVLGGDIRMFHDNETFEYHQ